MKEGTNKPGLRGTQPGSLNAHVRQAIARDTPRGWRIDKAKSRDNIDGCVAMCIAVEAAETPVATAVFHGWLD